MRSEMSRFTGDIGREEEDGLGWDGLVESGREKRERETYDGLVRDAMLWRKRQIAATDTQSKAQPQHFVETEDPHTLKCKCGFLCVTQDMMRVHVRYPEAKLPDDLPDLDVTFLAAQPPEQPVKARPPCTCPEYSEGPNYSLGDNPDCKRHHPRNDSRAPKPQGKE